MPIWKRTIFRHGGLCGLALLALAAGCRGPGLAADPAAPRVGVQAFQERLRQGDAVLLDVRTPEEYRTAHIPGALNLDVLSPSFEMDLGELDADRFYLVYCSSGRRSARACRLMAEAGFHRLMDLAQGFKGWRSAGMAAEP